MRETAIEQHLRRTVKQAGGLCLKWVSPGFVGVPDRILLFPGGRISFVETKAPGRKERARQEYVQRLLRGLGFRVYSSIDSKEKASAVVREETR